MIFKKLTYIFTASEIQEILTRQLIFQDTMQISPDLLEGELCVSQVVIFLIYLLMFV